MKLKYLRIVFLNIVAIATYIIIYTLLWKLGISIKGEPMHRDVAWGITSEYALYVFGFILIIDSIISELLENKIKNINIYIGLISFLIFIVVFEISVILRTDLYYCCVLRFQDLQ